MQGKIFDRKHKWIRFQFQHCDETEEDSGCASTEERELFWEEEVGGPLFVIASKFVDFNNQTDPIQDTNLLIGLQNGE